VLHLAVHFPQLIRASVAETGVSAHWLSNFLIRKTGERKVNAVNSRLGQAKLVRASAIPTETLIHVRN
jgi:hypothetical protein